VAFLLENPPYKKGPTTRHPAKIGTSCRKKTKIRVFSPRSGVPAACLKGGFIFSTISHASNFGSIRIPTGCYLSSLNPKRTFSHGVSRAEKRLPAQAAKTAFRAAFWKIDNPEGCS
jgi:hypothetical protein